MTEGDTIARAKDGDREAMARLLERDGPAARAKIARTVPTRLQSVLSVDDVMQQTYTDAFLGIGAFVSRGERSFRNWLITLAKRNLVDAIRMLEADKRGGGWRRVEVQGDSDSAMAFYELLGGTYSTPSRKVAKNEAHSALHEAIQHLSPIYRQLITLYDLDGCSIEEVAGVLNRSPGAVYMMRARAHRKLCEIMGTAARYISDAG